MHRRNVHNAMIAPEALAELTTDDGAATARPRWTWLPLALALVALVAVAVVWVIANHTPADDSLEAGFARDMMVHHDQAVTMALIIRDRTDDPAMKTLATDMLLTQENQIGQMLGWLNLWGLPATGAKPAMSWMGHPTTGLMPGMATPEELVTLESLTGEAADVEFLRLMIRHHQAAIPMAETALQASNNAAVRDLARQILKAQEIEIANMEAMLKAKS
jgi:uncharacterized protein (DUF305 family)